MRVSHRGEDCNPNDVPSVPGDDPEEQFQVREIRTCSLRTEETLLQVGCFLLELLIHPRV